MVYSVPQNSMSGTELEIRIQEKWQKWLSCSLSHDWKWMISRSGWATKRETNLYPCAAFLERKSRQRDNKVQVIHLLIRSPCQFVLFRQIETTGMPMTAHDTGKTWENKSRKRTSYPQTRNKCEFLCDCALS